MEGQRAEVVAQGAAKAKYLCQWLWLWTSAGVVSRRYGGNDGAGGKEEEEEEKIYLSSSSSANVHKFHFKDIILDILLQNITL